jgi:hypothetical protein
LRVGDLITIKLMSRSVSVRITAINGALLSVSAAVPHGTNLEITYTAPVFKTFGKIAP